MSPRLICVDVDGTVTPVVSLPHDSVMVFVSKPPPIAERTGGNASSPMPADAPAAGAPDAVLAALGFAAQQPHRFGGAQHVLAFQQALDGGLAQRQGAQHQRPVRERLDAGHPDPSAQPTTGAGSSA